MARCRHATRLKIAGDCFGCKVDELRARLILADNERADASDVIEALRWVQRAPEAAVSASPTPADEVDDWAEQMALALKVPLHEDA